MRMTKMMLLVVVFGLTSRAVAYGQMHTTTSGPDEQSQERVICGTVVHFVHKVGQGWQGWRYSLYEGDRFFVRFSDGRALHSTGTPDITITVGGIYRFVVRNSPNEEGLYILVRASATDECGTK